MAGHELRVPPDMEWCFSSGDYYEKNVTHWFSRIVASHPRPVIYDVGANYGYFSVLFADRAQAIYAFEPVRGTYAVLEDNLTRNRLVSVKALQLGLSDAPRSVNINLYSSSGNNSLYPRTLPPGHPLQLIGAETISLVSLDDLIREENFLPPTIIKIDVEGEELAVLRGAAETLSRHRPFILLEYSDSTCRDAGSTAKDLLTELATHDYQLVGLTEAAEDLTLYPQERFNGVDVANIIAIPPGAALLA